jgi:glycosyltransferase involved in cell wall biosynthesis
MPQLNQSIMTSNRHSWQASSPPAQSSPAISVILPVFNAAAYVQEAVTSILEQTFGAFELILIDDGSSDETLAILNGFARSNARIRLIRQENAGVVAALNRGLSLARGRYVARMDADDRAYPERFTAQFEFLEAHPEVAVLGSSVRFIDCAGTTFGEWRVPATHRDIKAGLLGGDCPLPHPSVMARREVLVAAGGYCDRFAHAEDFELWLRLSRAHGFANLPQPLLDYRIHPQGVSVTRLREQLLATERALRERRGDLPEDIASTAAFRRHFSDQAFLRAELLMRAGCGDEARALYETISTELNHPWHRVAVDWASAGYLKAFNPRRRWRNLALSLAMAGLIRPGLLLEQLRIKLDFLVRGLNLPTFL